VIPRYQWIVLRSPFFVVCVEEKMRGQAYPAINDSDFSLLPFPLPPLAEQHRIVAKVDKLMALCDRLETARVEREETRDRLVASSLVRLNVPDPETFQADARFALNTLPALTARPDQIKQLRQTILNLAVRGKLVPQHPKDTPASELLKRIAAEKAQLIKEKKLKRQKQLTPIEMGSVSFDVPDGWTWAKADDVFLNITDGFHNTPSSVAAGRPYVTAKHIRPNRIDFDNCLYVDEKNHRELFAKTRVRHGDILIVNIGAGCGTPAMVEVDFEFSFKNVAIVNLPTGMDGNFILVFLLYYRELVFDDLIKGGAQPFLGLGMLREMLIPLPPLAEQHRIVAKVHELMALCDRLEASLNTAGTTRRQLLDALLAEALAPAEVSEREAAE
jgi:type I restriction enzyme S subunit